MPCHFEDGVEGDGQEKPRYVADLGGFDESPVLRHEEVVHLVVVGGSEVGNEGAHLLRDEAGTRARGLLFVHEVLDPDPVVRGLAFQLPSEFVVPYATDVASGKPLLKHPLGHTDGVLPRASGNVVHCVLVYEFPVDWQVARFGQNGVVLFQVVLVEIFWRNDSRYIQKWITHAKENARRYDTIFSHHLHTRGQLSRVICDLIMLRRKEN